ncbi:hypothetical protein [Micromonospora endophytica]|uniref:Uncharacterized protein n=1 Tax=Micromonospora endophytica TaxID=515350 RepID=A0A2W2CK40_9ACTN|nr:hypothetical protein [Micromonospora endophytica]PZF92058.1 hypothetical protein C1I93_20140 [Micromonospora endophytica]RIW51360.1 hypothetical protein D3H59_00335 [Micromonospora endophytica]BCJ62047.1 hypothetical protein Jiend_54690 [Micromonospora endophytica]
MTDHLKNVPVSRRDIIRVSGGGTLAAVALGSLGVGAPASAAPTGSPPAGPTSTAGGIGSAPASAAAGTRIRSTGADLLIRDGSPHWWLSPDIWVVPGTDPNGVPGTPAAGDVAYVWARVQNTGGKDAVGVQVRFYWGNPSVQMFYSTLNPIGTAYADIDAGDTQEVLCLVPWNVVTVNNGHECLVVVATLPGDPALPDAVDPVGYPNVAQRNLTLLGAEQEDFKLTLTVQAAKRVPKKVRISAAIGGELPKDALYTLGLTERRPVDKTLVEIGFSTKPITDPADGVGEPELTIEVPAGRSVPVHLTVRGGTELAAGEYQLVEVLEQDGDRVLGGISFAVVAGRKAR